MYLLKISSKPIKGYFTINLQELGFLGTQLTDRYGRLIHNILQFSQVFEKIQACPEFDNHPAERHLHDNQLTTKYYKWREKGMYFPSPVTFPSPPEAVYYLDGQDEINLEPLDLVQARKKIFYKWYKASLKSPKINELRAELSTQNVCIIDSESKKEELVTRNNMNKMITDFNESVPLSGWCFAMILMNWTLPDLKPIVENWQNTTLQEFVENHRIKDWEDIFDEKIIPISNQLRTLAETNTIYPPIHLVFNILKKLKLKNIKIGLLGMDPYINEGEAMGISFSVPPNIRKPPSLRNMIKEFVNEGYSREATGDLTDWVNKGVFLYNACLTVNKGKSGSHGDLWKPFTIPLIKKIDCANKGKMAWILLGNNAKSLSAYIEHNKVFTAVHPSPFSADKGFFGSNIFRNVENYLKSIGVDFTW